MAAVYEVLGQGSSSGEPAFAGVADAESLAGYSTPAGRAPPDGAEQRHFDELSRADFVRVVHQATTENKAKALSRSFAEYRDLG
eukprot:5807442-Alexandrium_andersonii.AAC.1